MHIPDGYLSPPAYMAAYAAVVTVLAGRLPEAKQDPSRPAGPPTLPERRVLLRHHDVQCPHPRRHDRPRGRGGAGGGAARPLGCVRGGVGRADRAGRGISRRRDHMHRGELPEHGRDNAVRRIWGVLGHRREVGGEVPRAVDRGWIGGYVGLNAAAIATGFELGIQPLIAHDAAGHALNAPYPLSAAVPAMAIPHLLVIGFVEAIVTGMVVAYLQKADPGLIYGAGGKREAMRMARKLWIGLGVLILLSPLGLIVPASIGAGTAWGEWSAGELQNGWIYAERDAGILERSLTRLRRPRPGERPWVLGAFLHRRRR